MNQREISDYLKDQHGEIVLQMKNTKVNDFIETGDDEDIEDKAILKLFVRKVKLFILCSWY